MALETMTLPVVQNQTLSEAIINYEVDSTAFVKKIFSQLTGYDGYRSHPEQAENKRIAGMLVNLSLISADPVSVISCGSLIYHILGRQVRIPKITEQTLFEVAGLQAGESEMSIERADALLKRIAKHNPGIAETILFISKRSGDPQYTTLAGAITYSAIEHEVFKKEEETKRAIRKDRKGVLVQELKAKLAQAVKTEHFEIAAQISSELKELEPSA